MHLEACSTTGRLGPNNIGFKLAIMTEIRARRILIGMMAACVLTGLYYTFIQQEIFSSLICISSFFIFRFLLDNPKMMVASSYKEFGKLVDDATGKANLAGSPWYFLIVIISAALHHCFLAKNYTATKILPVLIRCNPNRR